MDAQKLTDSKKLPLPELYIVQDAEAGTYTTTSPAVPGLVAEAKGKNELIAAVFDCMDLLECQGELAP